MFKETREECLAFTRPTVGFAKVSWSSEIRRNILKYTLQILRCCSVQASCCCSGGWCLSANHANLSSCCSRSGDWSAVTAHRSPGLIMYNVDNVAVSSLVWNSGSLIDPTRFHESVLWAHCTPHTKALWGPHTSLSDHCLTWHLASTQPGLRDRQVGLHLYTKYSSAKSITRTSRMDFSEQTSILEDTPASNEGFQPHPIIKQKHGSTAARQTSKMYKIRWCSLARIKTHKTRDKPCSVQNGEATVLHLDSSRPPRSLLWPPGVGTILKPPKATSMFAYLASLIQLFRATVFPKAKVHQHRACNTLQS